MFSFSSEGRTYNKGKEIIETSAWHSCYFPPRPCARLIFRSLFPNSPVSMFSSLRRKPGCKVATVRSGISSIGERTVIRTHTSCGGYLFITLWATRWCIRDLESFPLDSFLLFSSPFRSVQRLETISSSISFFLILGFSLGTVAEDKKEELGIGTLGQTSKTIPRFPHQHPDSGIVGLPGNNSRSLSVSFYLCCEN